MDANEFGSVIRQASMASPIVHVDAASTKVSIQEMSTAPIAQRCMTASRRVLLAR